MTGPSHEADHETTEPWKAGLRAVGAVLLFLLALRLIGSATEAAAPTVRALLERFARDGLSALGMGWLLTYVLTNGSVVAALGVALGASGLLDPGRTLLVVAGSRLGAAGFVILVGGLTYLRRGGSVRSALGLGTLTFVLSHAVYLPASAAGWVALPWAGPPLAAAARPLDLGFVQPGFLHALAATLLDSLGSGIVIVAGVGTLFLSVLLFDRALSAVDLAALRERSALRRPWIAFAVGAGVTVLTASVAFSIGALVPAYHHGALRRRELVPYILGANVATLSDTVVVALILGDAEITGALFTLMAAVLLVSLAGMLLVERWMGALDAVLTGVTMRRVPFVAFLLSLLLVPLLLVLRP